MADDIIDDPPPPRPPPPVPRSATNFDRPNPSTTNSSSRPVQQPIPQALPRPNATTTITQPTPQSLPRRQPGASSIIVSMRQKGNPILASIKSMPWEYGEIPADFVLGTTTCALFLQLKYHRLHPEYIYTRIKSLAGKYALRIVLVMVDIPNHEEALRELSKTSLINNVTLILCWSAAEGARYLELFKTYENAGPASIRQHQSTSYSDRMVDFITTPRTINRTDAVSLVSAFGTLRTAVNARWEEVSAVQGWGEKKVGQWVEGVREPFRVRRAKRKGSLPTLSGDMTREEGDCRQAPEGMGVADADRRHGNGVAEKVVDDFDQFADDEEALQEVISGPLLPVIMEREKGKANELGAEPAAKKRKPDEDPLNDGVMAALSKLRKS